jgi:type I restriction-modification system DNA methylase subunit
VNPNDDSAIRQFDFAWLLHIIKSLNHNGKAAIILPQRDLQDVGGGAWTGVFIAQR